MYILVYFLCFCAPQVGQVQNLFDVFSHTQRVSVTSDHPVSVVVVDVGVNFFCFSTSSLEPLQGFASNFCGCFLLDLYLVC